MRRDQDNSSNNLKFSFFHTPSIKIICNYSQSQVKSVVNLFGGKPLGIFEKSSNTVADQLTTWDMLHKKEMKLAVTHPPTNYFGEIKILRLKLTLIYFFSHRENDHVDGARQSLEIPHQQ
jgi:hypothetical protein